MWNLNSVLKLRADFASPGVQDRNKKRIQGQVRDISLNRHGVGAFSYRHFGWVREMPDRKAYIRSKYAFANFPCKGNNFREDNSNKRSV
jgi:hypothetical protein